MKLNPHQFAFLRDVAKLIEYVYNRGAIITGGELKRTEEQQKIYLDNGLSDTMLSNHLRSLAIDFNFFINGELTYDVDEIRPYGLYWKALNPLNRWGGDFKMKKGRTDAGHFERNL